eukprot:7783722-Pyramimonas_sp.AAC.1
MATEKAKQLYNAKARAKEIEDATAELLAGLAEEKQLVVRLEREHAEAIAASSAKPAATLPRLR